MTYLRYVNSVDSRSSSFLCSIVAGLFAVTIMALCGVHGWNLRSGDVVATEQKTGLYADEWKDVKELLF